MRLIDADALKRKAQKVATESWKMKIKANVETTLNQFIDWIDAMPTIEPERTGKWILCSERLPEEGCEFLCCDERGESIIGLPYADEEAYTGFSAESETEYIFNCVAWMPLPELYRGEGEER